eukprot:scaffold98856_cov30-Tisochrysis_lutea.AAC.1
MYRGRGGERARGRSSRGSERRGRKWWELLDKNERVSRRLWEVLSTGREREEQRRGFVIFERNERRQSLGKRERENLYCTTALFLGTEGENLLARRGESQREKRKRGTRDKDERRTS